MKIFVCEPLDPAALALLRQRAEVTDDPAQLGLSLIHIFYFYMDSGQIFTLNA